MLNFIQFKPMRGQTNCSSNLQHKYYEIRQNNLKTSQLSQLKHFQGSCPPEDECQWIQISNIRLYTLQNYHKTRYLSQLKQFQGSCPLEDEGQWIQTSKIRLYTLQNYHKTRYLSQLKHFQGSCPPEDECQWPSTCSSSTGAQIQ